MDTVSGDVFLAECARFIQYNEAKLGNVPGPSSAPIDGVTWYNPTTWLSPTMGSASFAESSSSSSSSSLAAQRRRPPPEARKGKDPATVTSPATARRRERPLPMRVSAHQLFYILLRCEGLGLPIGQLDVRIPTTSRPASYFAFISNHAAGSGTRRKDKDDTMSVSSLQTTMSTLGALGSGNLQRSASWWSSARNDPVSNIKYIYSAMTKLPSLRIIPPPLKLIRDFEDCPGDMSIPMDSFKNVQYLEFEDADPRSFIGWDRLSCQLRSLGMKRSGVEDIADIIVDAVIRDGKRRRGEPVKTQQRRNHETSESVDRKSSPGRDASEPEPSLPSLSWHFLRHLGLSDNSLTFLHSSPVSCIGNLTSLDLSYNLLNAVPPCLHLLPNLKSLNVSNNLIDSVLGIPAALSAIEALNLSHNRLESLCGLERLTTLTRIDLRNNEVVEAGEVGRLAVLPSLQEIYVNPNPLFEEEDDARVLVLAEFAREGRSVDSLRLDDETTGYFEKNRIRERVPNMDSIAEARSARRSEPGNASGQVTQLQTSQDDRGRNDRQTDDGETTRKVSEPVIRSVQHRGGHAGKRDKRRQTETEAQQRRNRRVVDLNDSAIESHKSDSPLQPPNNVSNGSLALAQEPTESDAIKAAARQGKLEEAMGAARLAGEGAEDSAASLSHKEAAAQRQPAPRVRIGRRSKQKSTSNGAFDQQGDSSAMDQGGLSADQTMTHNAKTEALVEEARGGSGGGEDLRRRIEALKGEVGDDWMRLLARGESVYVPSTSSDDR